MQYYYYFLNKKRYLMLKENSKHKNSHVQTFFTGGSLTLIYWKRHQENPAPRF